MVPCVNNAMCGEICDPDGVCLGGDGFVCNLTISDDNVTNITDDNATNVTKDKFLQNRDFEKSLLALTWESLLGVLLQYLLSSQISTVETEVVDQNQNQTELNISQGNMSDMTVNVSVDADLPTVDLAEVDNTNTSSLNATSDGNVSLAGSSFCESPNTTIQLRGKQVCSSCNFSSPDFGASDRPCVTILEGLYGTYTADNVSWASVCPEWWDCWGMVDQMTCRSARVGEQSQRFDGADNSTDRPLSFA